jgi:hypothetical protein
MFCAGATLTFASTGANPNTFSGTSDGNGHATFTYSGTVRASDTVQAATTSMIPQEFGPIVHPILKGIGIVLGINDDDFIMCCQEDPHLTELHGGG